LIHHFGINAAFIILTSAIWQANSAESPVEKAIQLKHNDQSHKDHYSSHELEDLNEDSHWIEKLHYSVSDSVYQSAVWFDRFFVNESNDYESPQTNARIRFSWKPKARDWNDIDARFRIKVRLPHFENRVDLILSDDEESVPSQFPLDTINSQSDLSEEHFAAAFRYTHNTNEQRLLESRIGLSGGDLFFKIRHKRYFHWQQNHSIRLEPSVYYFIGDGAGAKLDIEYDYQYSPNTQYRLHYSVKGSQAHQGLRWKHGLYRLKQLGTNRASIIGFKVQGVRNNQRGFDVDKYTLSYRYRFNAVRKWLFFEAEPFLQWPEDENYSTTPGIIFRVEGYFNKG
jgi:hypothetical protein